MGVAPPVCVYAIPSPSPGGVYGTPLFYINGMLSVADATWTVAQWKALLDPLVNSS